MDKTLVETLARRMHPDLYESVPMNPEVRALVERYTLTDHMREIADFLDNRNVNLPWSANVTISVTEHYTYDETLAKYPGEPYQSRINVEATQKNIARVIQAARAAGLEVKKEYSDSYLHVKVTTKSGGVITFSASRESVCTRRVVGKKYVPARYVDEVEYDCEKIAFTVMDVD